MNNKYTFTYFIINIKALFIKQILKILITYKLL